MFTLFFSFLVTLRSCFQTRAALQLEILALRHQINVLRRSQGGRVRLTEVDRLLWAWLLHLWSGWRSALLIVKPETVIAWHRRGFRLYWTWKSRPGRPGRPEVSHEVRELIRKMMCVANPLWGAPRIHGELLKLGIEVSQATVAKYMARPRRPPSQTWHTFLSNHVRSLVSTDFFVVPTVSFRVLFVFVVLAHHRRRVIHFNVTANPTSEWTAQQIAEAFPWNTAPRYLLHDRDALYGDLFRQRVRGMGIREVLTAPRSPWQSPYVERLIGSIRREGLDHLIVLNQSSLRRTLKIVFRLLLALAYPLIAGQRCAGDETSSTAGAWRSSRSATGGRSPSPLRTPSGLRPDSLRKHWLGLDDAFGWLAGWLPRDGVFGGQVQTLVFTQLQPRLTRRHWSVFEYRGVFDAN